MEGGGGGGNDSVRSDSGMARAFAHSSGLSFFGSQIQSSPGRTTADLKVARQVVFRQVVSEQAVIGDASKVFNEILYRDEEPGYEMVFISDEDEGGAYERVL
nr:hypothetical protein Iba_chr10bCG6230 [Ipomoea batatas]